MRSVARLRWLANFDMESLLSSILRNGVWLCFGFAVASLIIQWVIPGHTMVGDRIQAKSVPLLITTDLRQIGSLVFWPRFLVDMAATVLMFTPYLRVVSSFLYFVFVDRNGRQALFMSFVLLIVSLIVLSDWV